MHTDTADRRCAADRGLPYDQPGFPHQPCAAYDWTTKRAAAVTPPDVLCELCLEYAERDLRRLAWDHDDLDDALELSLSQALDTQPSGHNGPPMPMSGAAEALQAEIWHVLTTWEAEVRSRLHLSDRRRAASRPTWAGTGRDRHRQVAAAVVILAPRVRDLSRLEAIQIRLSGVEDPVRDVSGVEAVWHLRRIHSRARAMLGRTCRTMKVPGTCSGCNRDELHRDEPRYERDPCPVYCDWCRAEWTYDEYERYVTMLVWPKREAA